MDGMFDEAGLPPLTECGYVATNVSDVLILHSPGDPFFQLGVSTFFRRLEAIGIHYLIRYLRRSERRAARHRRIFLSIHEAALVEIASDRRTVVALGFPLLAYETL